MPRLTPIHYRKLAKVFERKGFVYVRTQGVTTQTIVSGFTAFGRLDCSVNHTIIATWNGQTVRKDGISVGGYESSDPTYNYFICNGSDRSVGLKFPSAVATPTPTP